MWNVPPVWYSKSANIRVWKSPLERLTASMGRCLDRAQHDALPLFMVSRASAGGWNLLEASVLKCLVVDASCQHGPQLGLWLERLCVASLCGLSMWEVGLPHSMAAGSQEDPEGVLSPWTFHSIPIIHC